uniref:ANK_REP_REGION domain-containing protein n=1 Tax=Anopheles funestus TaxID=62324 RepID=A0A182RQU8_ANOFN
MESSKAATVPTTVNNALETATTTTVVTPTVGVSLSETVTPVVSDLEHDKKIPTAVTTESTAADDTEPKIEQVTPADMEPQSPPNLVDMQELVDPLAVSEDTPEISTTSIDTEKSLEELASTIKDTQPTVEKDPLAGASNGEVTPEQALQPTTSTEPAVVNEDKSLEKSSEVSESTPTSTSSPGENPATSSSNVVEEGKCSNTISLTGTPPPVVESSTASPEKSVAVVADNSPTPPDGPGIVLITTSTVDSSSSSDKTDDSNVETVKGPSSNCSDNVNSINNDCSSSSNISHSKEAESQSTATENGSASLKANTTTTDPSDRTRSPFTEIVPPSTEEVTLNAVIEKETLANNVDSNPNGVVISRQEADQDEKQPLESLTRLDESHARLDENKPLENNSETSDVILNRPNGQEETRETGCDPSNSQKSDVTPSAAGTVNDANGQDKREETFLEHRESSAIPPEPDPGPPVEEQFRPVDSKSAESCNNLKENDTANSATSGEAHYNSVQTSQNMDAESSQNEMINGRSINTLSTGVTGRSDYHQQQQTPPVSARNPLQFTEVANDEVELKVDGGHLLDRVIKLSLLKGLQDSGKRLAKSSLIISGAGASIGEAGNGEATLATTSSLSKAKSAAAGLRLMEEHKTTPPALVANGGAVGNAEGAHAAVTEIASSTKEVADSPNRPTAQSGGRIRHSSDTTVSSSPSGELDGGVRSSSNSSLDFREEERSPTVQAQEAASLASSLEASSSRSCSTRDPVAAVVPHSNEHLPMKARKPQYYASIPDFSKQQFSPAAPLSTVSTSTTTTPKSLAQLHMKTPDFSRLACDTVPSSQTSPSSTTTNAAISTVASTNTRTTSELKISNPDFTKGFATQSSNYSSSVQGNDQQPPGNASSSPYVTQDTFSKLIKERNYIADLQLKNPPPSQNQVSSDGQTVVKSVGSQNDYPTSRVVVVDTTSTTPGGAVPFGHATSTPIAQYHRTTPIENGMEPEPKAHVIHKNTGSSSASPLPPSQGSGVHQAPKTWNPPEFTSKHFTQGPPSNSRTVGSNGAGPSSTSPSSRDPSPAPSSSSPHQPSYGQHPGALVNYTGKSSHAGPTSVVGSERIIVNNVRTYYPEASVPPASASVPHSGTVSQTSAPYHSLPKVKDPEFRLDQNREQLLLQEGTIVTIKQAQTNHATGRGQQPPPITSRSPSAERREAQMMQNSQDILYRDYKQHKKPTSSIGSVSSNMRPVGPSQSPVDRRSPYDPAAYYSQSINHHRPPVIPPQGAGLMHPPPPNWPGPGQHLPSQQMLRGVGGPGARSSPQDNGASPVSSPAPPPTTQHHYHNHQAPYYGQYKNAPSPVSGTTYGTNSTPAQPQGAGTKYPPQQHYPGGTSASERRHEVLDRGVGSGNYKGLDYNMEQKFAEVYQAHQAKEKQAAAEAAASSTVRQASRPAAGTASGSPGISSTPATSSKGPASYGSTGYEQYHPYYQHSQATPSPTSTPSPVPSPHHRKYSGPPSRDPSPLGQQPPQQHQHYRYGSSETLYHVPPGGPQAMYVHPAAPKPNEQGATQQPIPPASYYQSQPSSSSSYSSATTTYSNRPHHGVVLSSNHSNSAQQSVISGNPYDRYVHPYASSGSSQPAPGGQQQQQSHHSKTSLPYPPAGRLQGPPPLQSGPVSVPGQSPVIHPPLMTGSKNIPVRVIATAPPAAVSVTNAGSLPTTVSTVQPQGTPRALGQSNATSSSTAAPSQPVLVLAGEANGSQREMNAVAATTPVIIAPAKRESPLDLSSEPQNLPIPSAPRHVSVISPAIPPGYDKKTDAYMSANYRAVGGPLVSPAYQYSPTTTRLGPGPPGGYEGSPAGAPGASSSMGSASSKSVYYPPTGLDYGRPAGKSGSGSIVTGQAATVPATAANIRSNSSSQGSPPTGHPPHSSASAQPRLDDPRIEDRKFVESMLKKKTSPSSDVMADLQAGKFPTRIPQNLAPKKRVAAAAVAAAAAEAALAKTPSVQGGISPPTAPTPAKVAKYEDSTVPRAQGGPCPQGPSQGHPQLSPHGAPDGRYTNHSQGTPREGSYANYVPAINQAGHHYTSSSGKRSTAPEIPNSPTVHPSVITTNYHHHPPAVLQHQYATDARYYQHHTAVPVKSRDDPIIPVYHQPHLRGGSAVSYTPQAYGEPNAHPPYSQHHSEPMMYHKTPDAPPFRYGDSLKAPADHTAVHHMQSHIHYTGGNAGPMPKVGLGASHQYQHQQQPQSQHHSPQSAVESMTVSQYPSNVHPNYGPPQHHRGADQSVISKLRTSLELKEYEKQRINQLRKQPGMELADEDRAPKATMPPASPVATSVLSTVQDSPSPSSRFRTKGELKGYTPLPTPSAVTKPPRSTNEPPPLSLKRGDPGCEEQKAEGEEKKRSIVPPIDMDGSSALDILDWGSTCNEFVEQLQTGKKRGRRKRTAGTVTVPGSVGGRSWPAIDSIETTISVAEGSTTDLSAIPKEVLNSARSPHRLKGVRDGSDSSSDEDKPLLLLRQQSQQQQKDQEQVDSKAHAGMVQTEKVARNQREKQRLELQQKHEAKLGRSSSTDSETARAASAQRAKARVRKLRHRSSVVPVLSLKSSDGDGDVTADGGEDESGKQTQKRVSHALANSAKRKRIRGPGSRSSSSSSSSASESSAPALKKPENELPRKRGRPKGTGAGGKRAQQATSSRCQTGTIKQEPNENSDLSSDEESRAIRTPHKNGSGTSNNSDSTKKREGGAAVSNTGGSTGSGNSAGGKAQHGSKVSEGSTCNDEQKEKINISGAKKKLTKARTNSRSKADSSSDSSSASSSSSSSEEEEEEAEETMTRSRSKREAERRRSNSKVLRNDKIVENCPNPSQNQRVARNRADSERTPSKKTKARKLSVGEPTPKRSKSRIVDSDSDGPKAGGGNAVPRKRTRQASKNAPMSSAASGESTDSSSEDEGRMDLSERLRSRKVAKKVTEEPARKQPSSSSTKSGSRRESTTSAKGSESSTKKKGSGAGPSSNSALAGVKKSLKELNQTTASSETPDHFYPGWEKELYEYKRSLKVPPELITIDGGLYMHRISTSLPDLDSPHHSDGSETFTEIRKKLNQRDFGSAPPKRFKTKAAAKQQQQLPLPGTSSSSCTTIVKEEEHNRQEQKKIVDDKKFRSIIELLHRRCIAAQGAKPTPTSSSGRGKGSKTAGKSTSNTSSSENAKPKQEFELLPTPGAESESLFSKNSKKKKSLFDTAILKSRTRTEQKAMQSKEMIREVFGGDDERPQSAPPLSCGPAQAPLFEDGLRNVTFDERYNELMRNHDRIVDELDGGAAAVAVKQEPLEEEDEEEEEEMEDEEEDDDTQDGSVRMKDSERDTPSIASERGERELPGTPLSFHGGAAILSVNVSASGSGHLAVPAAPKKRGRGHRTSRRKGSSGFDYIRKKKKPSQQHHHGNHQHQHGTLGGNGLNGSIGVRKVTAFENMEGKDETHIGKEIRSWVLNKGVGESVMHKAARLGYTDVIVYCLERLDMDPDLKDNAGYTPLHEACAKGHLDIANYLLQYGASHSEPAPSGMRPLHEAVENSFVEIVRLLLAFGADPMLATYAGMTPMQLAESDDMTLFLEHHLNDVQSMAPNKIGWKFDGPWKIHGWFYDPEESGCNIFSNIPGFEENDGLTSLNTSGSSSGAISSASSKRCDSNSNIMHYEVGENVTSNVSLGTCDSTRKRNGICAKNLPVGLRNGKIKRVLPKQEERSANGIVLRTKLFNGDDRTNAEQQDLDLNDAASEDEEDGEVMFEYEEADRPLPPLYVLKDEYNERWMLMSDLCNFLKFKSKEAVLRQICPNNSTNSQRELIREMKIEEFLTRANCLQLLCAGEKLNIHASKVVLVKYNDSVKSLLQVQSFMTRI